MPLELVDTHCHIHEAAGKHLATETKSRYEAAGWPDPDEMITDAFAEGVTQLVCVGTTLEDSELAVNFVQDRANTWASIGLHPHGAKTYVGNQAALRRFVGLADRPKVVAIGECGLDYYYNHSSPADQAAILRFQLELAHKHDLPLIFHVRDAFSDFWPIFDEYPSLKGVIHSFSATQRELEQILQRGLYIGLNGIMTFTRDQKQLAAAKAVPLDRLVLETDAPFLTPTPYRGTICEPRHVRTTAEFLADLRREDISDIAQASTHNARALFHF